MNSRFPMLLVFSLMFVLLTGCAEESHSGQIQPTDESQEETVDIEMIKMNIQLFYADEQALELIETSRDIEFEEDEDKYKKAFLALTEVLDDSMTGLWKKEHLANIQFEEGVLTMEIEENGIRAGSSAERLQILSLLKTMFQFPEVNEIRLNDQDQDRYGGKIDITEPFTRAILADL